MSHREAEYHTPVLLSECLDGLDIKPDGVYVDATFGGGGHSTGILQKLDKGRLIAFDKDADALKNIPVSESFHLVHHDFIYMKNFLLEMKIKKVDGIMADLGVSSHQFDSETRGFSYRFDAPLDMRMDRDAVITAADIINQYPGEQLTDIFRNYGEIRNARFIADKIVAERANGNIDTTFKLVRILEKFVPPGVNKNKYFSQIFQALRIVVNDELNALKILLTTSTEMLKKGGRLVIISYHSLEDRLVKNFIRTGNLEGKEKKDIYGNVETPFVQITKKPIVPSPEEINRNNRARSARLRIGERI